ncbi:MAG: DUF4864 domain-containing protein, partial [Rhodobiaceae bacterium]|nr:DUF4864 domain-containing protein [Rhodobiaceae bacterium]
ALLQNRHQPLSLDDLAIRETIEKQVRAFSVEDGPIAFGFAAPDLQAQFDTPDYFMAMIRAHYRPIYFAQKLEFSAPARPLRDDAEMRLQSVFLVDDRGASHKARYLMQKQPDGSWKIAGCHLLVSDLVDI